MNDKKIYGLRGVQFGCGPNIGIGDASLIFNSLPEFSEGVDTGTAGLASAFTFGQLQTGHEQDLGFNGSYIAGSVAREAAIGIVSGGILDALQGIRAAGAVAETGAEVGSHVVYQGLDEAGNLRYVGITERAPEVRFAEHLSSGTARADLRYEVIKGATNLTKNQARIIEQGYINEYGLAKNGGQLLNKINSIAPKFWEEFGIKP